MLKTTERNKYPPSRIIQRFEHVFNIRISVEGDQIKLLTNNTPDGKVYPGTYFFERKEQEWKENKSLQLV